MTLADRLSAVVAAIGADVKALYALSGGGASDIFDSSSGSDAIASGYQRIVVGEYDIADTLDIQGALILL